MNLGSAPEWPGGPHRFGDNLAPQNGIYLLLLEVFHLFHLVLSLYYELYTGIPPLVHQAWCGQDCVGIGNVCTGGGMWYG